MCEECFLKWAKAFHTLKSFLESKSQNSILPPIHTHTQHLVMLVLGRTPPHHTPASSYAPGWVVVWVWGVRPTDTTHQTPHPHMGRWAGGGGSEMPLLRQPIAQ